MRFSLTLEPHLPMGSKRPEQVHKDLLSTDRKSRPDDEHMHAEDKQALHRERGKLAMPENAENPEVAALKKSRIPRRADGK